MSEPKTQVVRRVLVELLSDHDDSIVRPSAVDNSNEFKTFLNKTLNQSRLTQSELNDIMVDFGLETDVEDLQERVSCCRNMDCTWNAVFNELSDILKQGA